MTDLREASPAALRRDELRLGELLAEGGEGKVFALPLQPHLVFKQYQHPTARRHLGDLVSWPEGGDPELAARVRACASWPTALVVESPTGGVRTGSRPLATGVVMPRAPRRFALRHRDGTTRLASLSYLTADPAYRAVAYGIELPPAFSPERLGLVYALARLLESFEKLVPTVGHGDLSAKNVLWSLQRGPEIFVIDCDNCERFGPEGAALSGEGRRRAMTPNWDDPAVPPGCNPGPEADRYSLALIFLRVAGAANFPVQARQRQGQSITVDFPIPRSCATEMLLTPAAPLWDLCARGLSIDDPAGRPPASAWVSELEAVLDSVGASGLKRAVWATQGGGPASGHRAPSPAAPVGVPVSVPVGVPVEGAAGVVIRPVLAPERPAPPRRLIPTAAAPTADRLAGRPVALAQSAGSQVRIQPATEEPVMRQLLVGVAVALRWWMDAHRALSQSRTATSGRRARQLAFCVTLDVAGAAVALFVAAMTVAPILGI